MLKWFSRLSRDEIWLMHGKVIGVPLLKKCKIDRRTGYCTFWEGGWECEGGFEYLSTSYQYSDFSLQCLDACGGEGEFRRAYMRFMCEKFGEPYVVAYLEHCSGIPETFFSDILSGKGANNGNLQNRKT